MDRITGECPLGSKCEEAVETADGPKLKVCPWYTQIRGANPQGGEIDEWRCAIAWTPVLLIENAQVVRHTGAAIESFRNEMVTQNNQLAAVMLHTSGNSKLLEGAEDAENEKAVS